jgi:hypothetical protein
VGWRSGARGGSWIEFEREVTALAITATSATAMPISATVMITCSTDSEPRSGSSRRSPSRSRGAAPRAVKVVSSGIIGLSF